MDKQEKRNPIQPIVTDAHGVRRFKRNEVVRWLIDRSPGVLNLIAGGRFSADDMDQFHQLTGYSVIGAPLSNDARAVVEEMEAEASDPRDAEIAALRSCLRDAREGMRAGVAALYSIHPDNIGE